MDCSPPGSSVHGILQARILEWVAISFSRGSSWPRDQTWVSCTVGRFFTICPSGKHCTYSFNPNSEFGTNSWLSGKESVCNAGDPDSISGSGRSPGEGNGNLFQYSCLENFTDRGAWQAIVHGVPKSQTWLSMHVLLSQRPRWLWKILVRKFLHWPCYCSDGLGRY